MRLFIQIKQIALLFTCIAMISPALAKVDNAYISHHQQQNTLIINTLNGKVKINAYSDAAIAVQYLPTSSDNKAAHLPSYAIKEQAVNQPIAITQKQNQLTLALGKLTAVVNKSPFKLSFYQGKKLLIEEETGYFSGAVSEQETSYKVQGFRFKLSDDEKLLGGGERVLGMDRRGHRMPLYNRAHYGYETQSSQMNFSLPAVLSSHKYILLFDNSAKGWMDIGKSEANILQFEAVSGRMSYLVVAGETYPQLLNNYVELTGKQPMPPRWALGNYASRFGYRSEAEVRNVVDQFSKLDFPLDALILDLYWFGKDIKGHMGNLDWDKEAFPTPVKMISDLKTQGVNTLLITEPFVLSTAKKFNDAKQSDALAKTADGNTKRFDFYFGNTALVDVFSQSGQAWFKDIYKGLYQQGVAGWWGDLGEPELHPSDTLHTLSDGSVVNADAIHNAYGHQWAKMIFENQLSLEPTKRPFILMRSGFAGSQRYGMIPWTGDVSRSWGGLKPQVELSLQMGLLGMAYTHSDLGGFAGGENFEKEMYIRWLQYGVFQPIYRPHAQDHIASEVIFHDQQTQDILREFIKLRYKLLPYNYTLAYQNSSTGMPLMRPLFFESDAQTPVELSLMDNATSYLWGDAFLVTPVVEAGVKSVLVPLPKGVWFDYFTEDKYQGNQNVEISTTLKTLPVLVRAGSFIPMVENMQSTKDYDSSQLTLHYYADPSVTNAHYDMYEDDGKAFNANVLGQFEVLSFEAKQLDKQLSIQFSQTGQGYQGQPKQREITLVIHHWPNQPSAISIGEDKNHAFNWHKETQTLTVKFFWQHKPLLLNIQ